MAFEILDGTLVLFRRGIPGFDEGMDTRAATALLLIRRTCRSQGFVLLGLPTPLD